VRSGAPTDAAPEDPSEEDRWRRFAARDGATEVDVVEGDSAAGRHRLRPLHRLGSLGRRAATSEWTLAALVSAVLAVGMTWPLARDVHRVIPHDLGDPLLQAYTLGWLSESLRNDPAGIWDTNSFWPLGDSYLFTDTLLGYAPAAL